MYDWKWPTVLSFSSQPIINFSWWVVCFVCMKTGNNQCLSPFPPNIINFSRWVVFCVYMYDWKWPLLLPFLFQYCLSTSDGELSFMWACITGSDQCISSFFHYQLQYISCILCVHVWVEVTNASPYFLPINWIAFISKQAIPVISKPSLSHSLQKALEWLILYPQVHCVNHFLACSGRAIRTATVLTVALFYGKVIIIRVQNSNNDFIILKYSSMAGWAMHVKNAVGLWSGRSNICLYAGAMWWVRHPNCATLGLWIINEAKFFCPCFVCHILPYHFIFASEW